jgi:hypothetical protein
MSRGAVEQEVASFNRHFDRLSVDQKLCYRWMEPDELTAFRQLPAEEQHARLETAKSSVDGYMRCRRCGAAYTQMRPANDGDCPNGCTINPILQEG